MHGDDARDDENQCQLVVPRRTALYDSKHTPYFAIFSRATPDSHTAHTRAGHLALCRPGTMAQRVDEVSETDAASPSCVAGARDDPSVPTPAAGSASSCAGAGGAAPATTAKHAGRSSEEEDAYLNTLIQYIVVPKVRASRRACKWLSQTSRATPGAVQDEELLQQGRRPHTSGAR